MKKKININTWSMLFPWILTLLVFWVYPFISALYISFTKYNTLANTSEFIGFDNYIFALTDPKLLQALVNTLIFTIGTVPVTTALALFFAVLLNSKLTRFRNFFQATYFLPSVTSIVVVSLIFTNLYSQQGYINKLLGMLNLPYPQLGWLLDPATSLFSIMAMDVWMATGYYMILFLSGMQTIPNDLYEAAELSGANAWQKFWKITFPLLRPTLLFVVIINTIKSFQVFIEMYVMTKGGPLGSTTTMVYYVFDNAFNKMNSMGYASAVAFIVFIILLLFSIVQMKVLKSKT